MCSDDIIHDCVVEAKYCKSPVHDFRLPAVQVCMISIEWL